MAFDPYRILGLTPGASQVDIKRAYRQLAKAHHPDSAGAGEIQRFLTIQRAYEVLTTSSTRRWTRGARSSPPPPAPGEPWRADPDRARATRERARRRPAATADGARSDSASSGAEGASRPRGRDGGQTGAAGPAAGADRAGSDAAGASSGPAGPAGPADARGGGRPRSRRRGTRKATFGSTTYDDARDQSDPTWHGASWYGPTLGEYWTVNPREYADPRKHGPEYLARARRPLAGAASGEGASGAATDAAAGVDGGATGEPARDAVRQWPPAPERRIRMGDEDESVASGVTRPTPPRRTGASGAPSTAREAGRSRTGRDGRRVAATAAAPAAAGEPAMEPGRGQSTARVPSPAADAPAPWFGGFASELGEPTRRFLLALIAWPPIGIALATAIGSATGCIDASASCTDAGRMAPWLAQAAILSLLLALPTLAAILAAGSVTAVVASVPITALLVALGANYDPGHATVVLAVLLAAAWAVGVCIAVARRIRPPRGRPTVS